MGVQMPDADRLTLGAAVDCTDDKCGMVQALVVDPAAGRTSGHAPARRTRGPGRARPPCPH